MDPEKFTEVFENVSNKQVAHTVAGMAHWAGSGPPARTCRECSQWQSKGRYRVSGAGRSKGYLRPSPCAVYVRKMGRNDQPVPDDTAACKYFELSDTERPVFRLT